jgi:hypothetical protein
MPHLPPSLHAVAASALAAALAAGAPRDRRLSAGGSRPGGEQPCRDTE